MIFPFFPFILQDVYVCRYDGHCEVNMLTRKVCAACRLAKCFAVGMNTDLIRKEDTVRQKRKRTASVTEETTVMVCEKSYNFMKTCNTNVY